MKVVNKKKFIKSILVTVFIVIMMCICISKAIASNKVELREITYTVSKGETLWSIAKKYKQNNQDVRDYIYKIEKLNNMDSATIYEGQTIKIIIYKEAE
ncbi:MAG: LysM peptidoglycan-binding domain-containing protein [Clostridia bacterium]|nr:LysM peptidoglycan-binding domain-containing protein [Clostridia bacterium]